MAEIQNTTTTPVDYYVSAYSGEEWDAYLSSGAKPFALTKLYQTVADMNADFGGEDVQTGQLVAIEGAGDDFGRIYLKGSTAYLYMLTLPDLDGIKGPPGAAYVLTDEDKDEIAEKVLAALPTWSGGSY